MQHPFDSASGNDPRAAFGEARRALRDHLRGEGHDGGRGRGRRHGHHDRGHEFPGHEFPGHDFPGHHGPGPFGGGFGPPFPPGEGFPPGPGSAFRGGFPPAGPGGFGFGFGGGGRGRGRHGHGRGRARRGNIRSAVLLLLTERPMHGYEMIQEIAERSGGLWKPSPGSVYPTLQLLADEGLITTDQESGKRLYALTETGVAEAGKQDKTPPWEQAADDVDPSDVALRDALSTLMAATMQVSSTGSSDLRAKAAKLLVDTRRELYLILADAGQEDTDTVEDAVPEDTDES